MQTPEKGDQPLTPITVVTNTQPQEEPQVTYIEATFTAFYKMHATTTTEGRYEGEDFRFDLSRMDLVKRGDHFDFKLTKIPGDFGFIGFVDADLGNNKYRIAVVKGNEYRRMEEDILQTSLEIPFDTNKAVKRVLFGPKSILSQPNPVFPYAFVSDHILISKKETDDFVECERMLLWFFNKDKQIDSDRLTRMIQYHFDRRKHFLYPKAPIAEKTVLKIDDLKAIVDFAFSRNFGSIMTKEIFADFWTWYGCAAILILKVATLWSEGRIYGFSKSVQEMEGILQNQSIGSFVLHIPFDQPNKLILSYVKSEIPSTLIEHQEWNCDNISEIVVIKGICERQLKRYFLSRALWTNTKWGDVRMASN